MCDMGRPYSRAFGNDPHQLRRGKCHPSLNCQRALSTCCFTRAADLYGDNHHYGIMVRNNGDFSFLSAVKTLFCSKNRCRGKAAAGSLILMGKLERLEGEGGGGGRGGGGGGNSKLLFIWQVKNVKFVFTLSNAHYSLVSAHMRCHPHPIEGIPTFMEKPETPSIRVLYPRGQWPCERMERTFKNRCNFPVIHHSLSFI
jgi:hypothetical protein